jgi:hypothetical protein
MNSCNSIKNYYLPIALSQSFNPIGSINFDPIEDIKNRKALIKCMIKKLMNDLLNSLFILIKKEILEVVSVVAILYAKEGLEKYKLILASLKKF